MLIASDMNMARSIVKMKNNEDKMRVVGSHQVLAFNGEPGKRSSEAGEDGLSVTGSTTTPAPQPCHTAE